MKSGCAIIAVLLAIVGAAGCKRQPQAGVLNLFAWSEYVPQEVVDGFTKETGIKVNYETYDSNEAMMTKLVGGTGRYDLIQPSEYTVEHLISRGMLEAIARAKVPNLANLDPAFRNLPYDPEQKFSVPYMAGTVGIVINTDVVKEPIRGYADVFQQKFRKRIVVIDDNREIVSWALDVLGISVNDVTAANLQKARPLLEKWVPLIRDFASAAPEQDLLSGDCDIGIVYSGDAAKLYEQNPKFRYVLPAEGAHQFVDNLCIPKGALHTQAALKFIDYILRPDVSKRISEKFPYTNPNAQARKLLSPQQLGNPASYPTSPRAQHLEVFHDIGSAMQDIAQLMTEIRSRS